MSNLCTEYDSSFDEDDSDEEIKNTKKRKNVDDCLSKRKPRESKEVCESQLLSEERKIHYFHLTGLDAYSRHKKLINDYVLCYAGGLKNFQRDRQKDKTDWDVIQEHHQFVWSDDEKITTWEKQLAKKYYDKLFKEYCLADLSQYKENKIGLRWRTEKEVIQGKGQFICGNKVCTEDTMLRSWEVNFAYIELGKRKNTLIKLRLCPPCSKKLNYHHKYKEYAKPDQSYRPIKKSKTTNNFENTDEELTTTSENNDHPKTYPSTAAQEETNLWSNTIKTTEERSNAEEFEEYFQDLLL